jgi:Ring finger domain
VLAEITFEVQRRLDDPAPLGVRLSIMAIPARVCSLKDQPPLVMRLDESSKELYIDYLTPVREITSPSNGGERHLRNLPHQDESLQPFAGVVRLCPCSQDVHNPLYCLVEHDVCGMSKANVLTCWKTSGNRLIGSYFPFTFFWIPIVILIMGITYRGRLAQFYIRRVVCRESAEQQLDILIRDRPDRVDKLIRNYERRMARVRRTRVAAVEESRDPSASVADDLSQEASSKGLRGKSHLVLKTKMLSARTTLEEEEEEEQTCTICLGELHEGMRIGSLTCHHEFHVDCLKVWLKRKNHCPLCKGKVAELRVTASETTSSVDAEP